MRLRARVIGARVQALLCLQALVVSCALADEATDRLAITRAIAEGNFTAEAAAEPGIRVILYPPLVPPAPPIVTISHEPWGEATFTIPPMPHTPPVLVARAIRFLTPDVALADVDFSNQSLLFVMKKTAEGWKIASLSIKPGAVPMRL